MDLNIKCKTTTLLEEDKGKILWNLGLGDKFLDLTPLTWSKKNKEKTDKWDRTKI